MIFKFWVWGTVCVVSTVVSHLSFIIKMRFVYVLAIFNANNYPDDLPANSINADNCNGNVKQLQ